MQLEGKVATVTGAGRGIGEAIARAFAREGASVVVADLIGESAESVAGEIRAAGGAAEALAIDVGNPADARRLVDTAVARFGRLDIHVNNAGVSATKLFVETTLEEWERILRVNLTGAFLCAQAAAREMLKRQSGRIINITSLSGQRGGVGRAAYGASKAGLDLLTRVMSVELAAQGITVNNIAPGAIATRMAAEQHDEATRAAYHYLIPQRRYGTPEEIADAAVFLASDAGRHVCGHTLNVDGGFLTAGLMFELAPKGPEAPQAHAPGGTFPREHGSTPVHHDKLPE